MPAWPGGPCPKCGENMPENMVHCRNCRYLLNQDLEHSSVEIPTFMPLQELDSFVEQTPRGFYIACPHCDRELRVNAKYTDQQVACNYCSGAFRLSLDNPKLDVLGLYADCPHCQKMLRISRKYVGIKVACNYCTGRLVLVEWIKPGSRSTPSVDAVDRTPGEAAQS